MAIAAASFGFSAVQAALHAEQRSFFLALAFYAVVAVMHDFRELRRCRQEARAVLLTGAEYGQIVQTLAELVRAGHRIRAEHVAAVLGWPLPKVREALQIFRRIGIIQ